MLHDERTNVVQQTLNVVRASYEIWYSWDNRATVSQVTCDSREIVVRQPCNSRTIVLLKIVYFCTHDNLFIAPQSSPQSHVRYSQDSQKTVTW